MPVNIGTSTNSIATSYSSQRKLVKTSLNKLVLFAYVDNGIRYKTSDDNGSTWSSWVDVRILSNIRSFSIYMDINNDILLVFEYWDGSSTRIYFKKLTYSGGSWSLGSDIYVKSPAGKVPSITKRANGSIWISYADANWLLSSYSIDGGTNWNHFAIKGYPANLKNSVIIPYGNNLWIIAQGNNKLTKYEYITSWDDGIDIAASGITDDIKSLGVLRVSDSEIYAATMTSNGIKIYKWNGSSWDSGILLSDNANDNSPAISFINNQPVITWCDYDGANYNIVYRRFNGSTWSSQIVLTNDANGNNYPSVNTIDAEWLYIEYTTGVGSPYTIYFDKVDLYPTKTKTITSDVEFSLTRKNIISDVHFKSIGNQKTILSDVYFYFPPIQKNILSDVKFTVDYDGKFIDNQNLYIITDTSPSKLIKVDLSVSPPTYNIYTLTGFILGKELIINHDRKQLYASFNNGKVAKISLDDPDTRESIYVGENTQLISITHNPDYLTTFVVDNDLDSLFVIDEATYEKINTDFRFLSKITKTIKNVLSFVFKKTINTDFRFLLLNLLLKKDTINTDFRFNLREYGEVGDDLISADDFTIKINNEIITDFVQSSIKITLNVDEKSQTQFVLTRKHDKLNYTLEGIHNQITNNNNVEILINGVSVFTGKINQLDCSSSDESVIVYAKGDEYAHNTGLINLSLPTLNEQLHPYHVLIDDITINNPYIDPSEENPEFYKGITVDLGTEEHEIIERVDAKYIFMTPEEFEEFIPDQNYTYFWYVSGSNFITGWSFSRKYIGTSLASLYSDTYEIEEIGYKKQRIYDNVIVDLGNYNLGSAPYKEISVKNGRYNPKYKWEDKPDGLYDSFYNLYNFVSYAKKVAAVEYEKIKNINGQVLPRTSASISLTIDAFLYYGLKLLNRINIVNTTESGIYESSNGFPLSIKSIMIDSGQMKVNLEINNEWANSELDALDATLPKEPQIIEEVSFKVSDKFDLPKEDYID